MEATMVQCSKCKKFYPAEQFYKRPDKKSGRESNCSHCVKTRKKKWFATHKHDTRPRYRTLVQAAKTRKIELSITQEQFELEIKKPCHYCKKPMEKHTGSGLDRLDCKIGYHLENIVSCCTDCNLGKGDRFTSKEWKIMINALLKSRIDGSNGEDA